MKKLTLKNFCDSSLEVIKKLDIELLRSYLSSLGLDVLNIYIVPFDADGKLDSVKFRCLVPNHVIIYSSDFIGEFISSFFWFAVEDSYTYLQGRFYYV